MNDIDAVALSSHFRELQQEKRKLENKLEHLKMKRKDLESKQDTVAKTNLLLNQKNDNMNRTFNVANKKVQETQFHVDKYESVYAALQRLQKINDDFQKKVSEVKQQISNDEKKKEHMIAGYLAKYDELSQNFRGARKYYNQIKNSRDALVSLETK